MGIPIFRASLAGQAKIKQARERKGWTVREEDDRPLKEASKFLIHQHAEANEWGVNEPKWLRDFARLFRVEKHQDINKIKTLIAKSKQASLLEQIEQLIEAGEVFAKDISYGTWSRFASLQKRHGFKQRTFKAYCHILGLNWQEIAEDNSNQLPPPAIRSRPYNNLPTRYHTALIGREKELTRLLELLSRDAIAPYISVEGIGGAGKTSLVLEAAYRCLEASGCASATSIAPTFDAIIFTSAKQQHLMGNHILQRHRRERTLHDIFRAIFRTLESPEVIPADFEQQLECIQSRLAHLHTLLIIDNLETLEDQEAVVAFLYELPPTVKVVITTRVRGALGVHIYLECLPLDEGLRLIEHQAREQSVQLKAEQFQTIYTRTNGLPLGIVYAIGQLSVYGTSANVAATRLLQANSDLAQYCFEESVQRLRGQPAHLLLMGLALFAKSASPEAIARVALREKAGEQEEGEKGGGEEGGNFSYSSTPPASPASLDPSNALAQLYRLRLVMQREERYDMHPLTREYALAELKAHSQFERQARERWLNWYLRFTESYGQHDWRQWQDYQKLDQEWENLQAAIDWCIHQNRYEQVKQFWQHVKGYTYVCGYWHERLTWIDWLLQAARERQDKSMMAEALGDKGWTLTLMVMGKPEQLAEVDALFEEQLSNLQEGEDLILQLELTYERVVLAIHQRDFDRAHQLLAQWKDLLARAELEESKRLCQQIRIDYYEAEVWFRTENYKQAKLVYQRALELARVAQWQQVEVYILNWLVDVALAGEGNLDEAERLLNMSMPIALARNDKRSITFHKRSWAHLERMRGNFCEFQRWATEAKEGFESLGMLSEAQEMHSWLDA